ncbi:MAG TPA: XdhC family protein [Ilumatobacter sp.]|nr:XdhC family protein [Ilumatobacter sp.]
MYEIGLTVQACLRAGTRVDVAWTVATADLGPRPPAEAVAFTPGGGKVGGVLKGALDERLAEVAAGLGDGPGRLVDVPIGPVEALIAGLPADGSVRALIAPAHLLPNELWPALVDRGPIALVTELAHDVITATSVFTEATIDTADAAVADAFGRRASAVTKLDDGRLVTVLWPEPQLVLAGQGDYAEAIAELATWLGWSVTRVADPVTAEATAGALGAADAAVVVGHDYETTGATLLAALSSQAGYVAALGAPRVRQLRANWLAERGATDLVRLHMPAGLDLGAKSPREVALSVLSEAHAARTAATGRPLRDL